MPQQRFLRLPVTISHTPWYSTPRVVRNGTTFGADFLAYPRSPAAYHATFAVVAVPVDVMGTSHPFALTDIAGMSRVCETVAKSLLLCKVTPQAAVVDTEAVVGSAAPSVPGLLDATVEGLYRSTVDCVRIQRWLGDSTLQKTTGGIRAKKLKKQQARARRTHGKRGAGVS